MKNNETAALDLIISWEGSEVNVSPQEPGGISKYGVSLQTYADFCKKSNLPSPTANTIASFTEDQARTFYQTSFLPAVRFDDLPSGVDVRLVDIAVSLGTTGAINLLQMALLQWPLSNTISDELITTLNTYSANDVIHALSAGWIAEKHSAMNPKGTARSWDDVGDGSGHGDGHGWTNRNIALYQQCIKLVGANT